MRRLVLGRRFGGMTSNALTQTLTLVVLSAHGAALVGVVCATRGLGFVLALNTVVALVVLLYAASRARYIWAAADWPYLGLVGFELLVLAGALWAYRGSRPAAIWSYVVLGLHGCASVGAVVFAFCFKITRLM